MKIAIICAASFIAVFILTKLVGKLKMKKYKIQMPERNERHSTPEVYDEYCMTSLEKAKYIAFADIIIFAASYLFLRNVFLCLCLCLLSLLYPEVKKKKIIEARKIQLTLQFKDALNSIAASLSVGRSVESAFSDVSKDLELLYSGENVFIINELELINRKLDMNETLVSALEDFSQRASIDDIKNFVDVFAICKNTGGNLVEVIKNTASVISQKIEIRNEIDVIVAEQRLNQRILSIMPFGLMTAIVLGSPDYVKPLYSPAGNVVMLVVLGLVAGAYFVGDRIINIKV
jgi:tight adherence protein B